MIYSNLWTSVSLLHVCTDLLHTRVLTVLGLSVVGCPFLSLRSGQGSWEIGIIQEVDEATGDVTDIKSVCTSLGFAAEGLSGPTDVQLDGVWECKYSIHVWQKQTALLCSTMPPFDMSSYQTNGNTCSFLLTLPEVLGAMLTSPFPCTRSSLSFGPTPLRQNETTFHGLSSRPCYCCTHRRGKKQ